MLDQFTRSLQGIDDALSVKDDEGCTMLQVALAATFYIENAHRDSAREAIGRVCEAYAERYAEHLRWTFNQDTERLDRFESGDGKRLRERLSTHPETREYTLMFRGGEDWYSASPWYLEALGVERRSYNTLSYVRVCFPLLALADTGSPFHEIVLGMCRSLRPVSGYAGISLVESGDTYLSGRYEPVVYQMAQRFPGLEVDYPTAHTLGLSEGRAGGPGIKGAGWLTVLSDRWLDEMGGMDKLIADVTALDPRFSFYPYDGGLLVRAGALPELGDARRDLWPELQCKLARYLKPIRVTDHPGFHYDNPGRMHKRESEAWLRRFDDR